VVKIEENNKIINQNVENYSPLLDNNVKNTRRILCSRCLFFGKPLFWFLNKQKESVERINCPICENRLDYYNDSTDINDYK